MLLYTLLTVLSLSLLSFLSVRRPADQYSSARAPAASVLERWGKPPYCWLTGLLPAAPISYSQKPANGSTSHFIDLLATRSSSSLTPSPSLYLCLAQSLKHVGISRVAHVRSSHLPRTIYIGCEDYKLYGSVLHLPTDLLSGYLPPVRFGGENIKINCWPLAGGLYI